MATLIILMRVKIKILPKNAMKRINEWLSNAVWWKRVLKYNQAYWLRETFALLNGK